MPRWPSLTWSRDVQEIAGTQFGSSEISAFVTPKPRPPLVHLGADIISLRLFMHAFRRLWMVSGASPGVTAQESDSWRKANLGTNQASTSGSINYPPPHMLNRPQFLRGCAL
jgi:hypothetical protein